MMKIVTLSRRWTLVGGTQRRPCCQAVRRQLTLTRFSDVTRIGDADYKTRHVWCRSCHKLDGIPYELVLSTRQTIEVLGKSEKPKFWGLAK